MQTSNSVLRIEESIKDGEQSVTRGAIYRRKFVVQNLDQTEDVSVNVWLDVLDPQFSPLLLWYTFSPSPPVVLRPGEPCDISLSFEVPLQAKPALYNYSLILDCAQYPEQRQTRPLQLKVLPAEAEALLEPEFSLEPVTTSAAPHPLQDEETLTLTINVTNRSNLTDRFYLNCPDLSPDWFTRKYPESTLGTPGFLSETNGLQLNPKDTGEIKLLLHPPRHTLAGNYCVTIQLTSQNNPGLTLLDAIYLSLQPNDSLDSQLVPPIRIIPEEPGDFTLTLRNLGNTRRQLLLSVNDQERLFKYRPSLAAIDLEPGESFPIPLEAKPQKFWRRSLRGKNLEFGFDVGLTNRIDPSVSEPPILPKLPDLLPQGTIIWRSRPVWLLWLLLLLALSSLLGALFVLWFNLLRPTVTPEVLAFAPSAPPNKAQSYQEGDGEQIRLDWAISHLEQIEKVTVIRLERGTETFRKSYFLQHAVPEHLARKDANQTNNFCWATEDQPEKGRSHIGLKPVQFLGVSIPLPGLIVAPSSTLSCQGIITPTRQAGDYIFQIQVFTDLKQKDPIATRTTDSVSIKPLDKPQIIAFTPAQLVYQEAAAAETAQTGGTGTNSSTALGQSSSASNNLNGVVQVNWNIANVNRVEEIKVMSASPDGTAQTEMKRYRLVNNTIPPDLRNFCTPIPDSPNNNLVCRNVPTNVRQPGDYIFKLVVTYREEQNTAEVTANTEAVKIIPRPLNIVSFKVNDQEVKQNPKQVYLLTQPTGVMNISLSWNVQGGEGTKVEITPAPGPVPLQGQVNYALSAPSAETITITVSNPSGNQISQSAVVQTLQAQQPAAPRPSPEGNRPSSQGAASSPSARTVIPPLSVPVPSPSPLPTPMELPARPN